MSSCSPPDLIGWLLLSNRSQSFWQLVIITSGLLLSVGHLIIFPSNWDNHGKPNLSRLSLSTDNFVYSTTWLLTFLRRLFMFNHHREQISFDILWVCCFFLSLSFVEQFSRTAVFEFSLLKNHRFPSFQLLAIGQVGKDKEFLFFLLTHAVVILN